MLHVGRVTRHFEHKVFITISDFYFDSTHATPIITTVIYCELMFHPVYLNNEFLPCSQAI